MNEIDTNVQSLEGIGVHQDTEKAPSEIHVVNHDASMQERLTKNSNKAPYVFELVLNEMVSKVHSLECDEVDSDVEVTPSEAHWLLWKTLM